VVLYETLAGRRPFKGKSSVILDQILHVEPPKLQELDARIPARLAAVCGKALAKSPADRYQSAEAMQYDLSRVLGNQPTLRESIDSRRQTIGRRGFLGKVMMGGGLMAAGGALGWSMWPGSSPKVAVTMTTNPAGAKITFCPLDAQGIPLVSQSVAAGTSPVEVDLLPGDYLVVAEKDGEFHEVFRRVPRPLQLPQLHPHIKWQSHDKAVVLPTVSVVVPNLDGMKLVGGTWIDLAELPASLEVPVILPAPNQSDPSSPYARIPLNDAVAFLERVGKRLPFHHELFNGVLDGLLEKDSATEEWTATISHTTEVKIDQPVPMEQTLRSFISLESVKDSQLSTHMVVSQLSFRGARSALPLTARKT
ncbi:MAG: hypothetical protein ACR2NP_05810, partial [Pirellulaceae bacterium]